MWRDRMRERFSAHYARGANGARGSGSDAVHDKWSVVGVCIRVFRAGLQTRQTWRRDGTPPPPCAGTSQQQEESEASTRFSLGTMSIFEWSQTVMTHVHSYHHVNHRDATAARANPSPGPRSGSVVYEFVLRRDADVPKIRRVYSSCHSRFLSRISKKKNCEIELVDTVRN